MSEGSAPEIPREFEPIKTPEEAIRLLKEGAKTLAATMVWTKSQEHVINTHLSLFSDTGKSFYCWAPKGFDPRRFNDDLVGSGDKDLFFSVSLLRANIFFKARYLGFDHAGLQFKIPEKVFKIQRRKDLRFPIPDGLFLKVDFKDPLSPTNRITKPVLDISASGIAFIVEPDQAPLFPVGLTLEEFSFTVNGKKFVLSAEIRSSRPTREGARKKGVIIGVAFKNIRPGDSQHIAGFVFEESRKYFTRFM